MEQTEEQNQVQTTAPVPPEISPISQKPKSSRVGLWIIGGICFMIGILVIAWFYLNRTEIPRVTSNSLPISVQTPSPQGNTVASGTKRLDTQRLSLDYPSDWEEVSTKSGVYIRSPGEGFYTIEFGYSDYEDYAQVVASYPPGQLMTVDGRRAVRYKDPYKEVYAEDHSDVIMIEQPVGIYMIAGSGETEAVVQRNTPYLDKLAASVKFNSFVTNGCGGVDTQGELQCSCNGQLTKPPPPILGPGHSAPIVGSYTCIGTCGSCCYRGNAQQTEFPVCTGKE